MKQSDQVLAQDCNRREFLKQTVAGVGLAATGTAVFSQDSSAKPEMPMVQLGSHRVSRLMAGSNPMLGYSHTSGLLSRLMMDYFTLENMVKVLERCLDLGINTWQTSAHEKVDKTLEALRSRGRDIQWIFLANNPHLEDAAALKEVLQRNKPMAVVHHGQVTDRLWREGQVEKAHDFVKRVQDLGVMGGLSSHNPAVIRHAESHEWKVDFYMTSFYRDSRSREELKTQLNEAPLGEVFLASDPPLMCEAIREVKRPCLAFKILAAGRNCDRPDQVANSFEYAFRNIKRSDAVIVGLFPRYQDQALEDAKLAIQFSALSQ
ncbi:MAG TPA: hypothetical protein VK731_01600 [Candidatus Cybelea sp.]|nr:hypothetical protein [Candidatus Cybelea sp.]